MAVGAADRVHIPVSADFQVVRYQRAERDAVFAFLRAAYTPQDAERLIRQWDWKYDANPFNREPEPYILLLKENTRIVGMTGGVPLRVCIDGTVHWVSHTCDWVVHPDYRDRRIARRLMERHRADRSLRFSWQNELSHERSRVHPGTGYLRLTPLVKPIDLGRLVKLVTGSAALGGISGAVAGLAHAVARPLRRSTAAPGITVAPLDTFDTRLDTLWQRVHRDYRVIVVRDRAYLSWRFSQRPDAQYTVFAAMRDCDVSGYLVVRRAESAGERWGYLVDFLVEGRALALFSLLVQHAVQWLRDAGVTAVACTVVMPPYRGALYRHGFCPYPWQRRGYLRTNLGSPDPAVQAFEDPREWFLTMGDGDLETAF